MFAFRSSLRLLVLLTLLPLAACYDQQADPEGKLAGSGARSPASNSSEEAQSPSPLSGAPEFLFLPPLAAPSNPSDPSTPFSPDLPVIVKIDEVDPESGHVLRRVATFNRVSDEDSEGVRVDGGKYLAVWHTGRYALAVGQVCRIQVSLLGMTLGSLLVEVGDSASSNSVGSIALGSDVPIRFWAGGFAVPALSLERGSGSSFTMLEGETQGVITLIEITNEGGFPLRVQNQVSITPSEGLTLRTDYPAGGTATTGSVSLVMNQAFSSSMSGVYTVTNRAFIEGSSIEVTDSFMIEVLPNGGHPLLLPLGANPDGVPANASTEVTFTAAIARALIPPAQMNLRRIDGTSNPIVATMRDDGANGDLLAGDGVYSARLLVHSTAPGALRYQASAVFPGVSGESHTNVRDLVVSCQPTTPRSPQPDRIVTDPEDGARFACNEALVSFASGITCSEATSIVEQLVGGEIIGSLPSLGFYQVSLPGPCTVENTYEGISPLQQDPRVMRATLNSVGEIAEFAPNDPKYGEQYGLSKIRADEAWVIARGGVIVAVVDSGVDYEHPDLAGQVLLGWDYVNDDNDPRDDNGHGTRVASIIAAKSDNGLGTAGVAWMSKVLAIKVTSNTGVTDLAKAAAAVRDAANQGAKVINCSFTFANESMDTTVLQEAVNHATGMGALVVVAAGNTAGQLPNKAPCAYPNVLCVGATNENDARWTLSSFGPHVDLMAPGAGIIGPTLDGNYNPANGSSFGAAFVSGSAAVLWSHQPSWTATQVRQRLEATAVPLAGMGMGRGRIDLFEAVFNGSFEDGFSGWTAVGTAGAVNNLGPLGSRHRHTMGLLSSGPDEALIETTLEQRFMVQPGVTNIPIRFEYNFVSEEYPEWVGRGYNDNCRVTLLSPDGTETQLAYEDINTTPSDPVNGIDFPGGDWTVGSTGWKTASTTVPVSGPGEYRIRIGVRDEGDGTYDSNLLIDGIRFK